MTTVHPSKSTESEADSTQPGVPAPPPRVTESPGSAERAPEKGAAEAPRGWLRVVVWLLVLVAIAGGGIVAVQNFNLFGTKEGAAKSKARPVPVVTATVSRGDVNLYLSGLLGTVTAFQTVTVRTRVDGEIMKVYYTEGQMVKENDPLVEIDPRPYEVQLAQAQGQLARDQALLTQGKKDLERDRKLAVDKAISPQALDAQVSAVGQYEGAVKADQAMIANAKLQITYCHITAPFGGRIGLRLVDMGNFVQASSQTPLAVITQLQPIAVIFPVPQDDIFRVQQKFNSKEDVVVEAWNETVTTKLASGKLLAIDNQVDTTTGTVKLKAIFQNEDNHLFPNEFVSMKLLIDTRHDVVIVPNAAVQHGPTSTFVYVVKPDKTVTMRPVTPGPSQSGQTIIDKGVAPGEIVVTEGTDKLQEKSKVQLPGEKSGDKTGEKAGGKSNKNAQASPAPKTEG